jgi:LAS superfamily LD-carboxypeptidase LdcB
MQKISLLVALLLFAVAGSALAAPADEVVKARWKKKKDLTKTTERNRPPTDKLAGLHPQARRKLTAALQDMQTAGLCPTVTSAYRSSAQQHKMYRCSHQYRCRARRGIYSAHKPGASLHEAGLAVDLAAVAHGKKRQRRLTRDGKKMVRVMRKHGFQWRYGLKDPAHFELEPRRVGYKNKRQAIAAAQRREARQQFSARKTAHAQPKARRRP